MAEGFRVTFEEVAEDVGRTAAGTRKWLHEHQVRAVERVPVGTQGTRALYDGVVVLEHLKATVGLCPACVRTRRGSRSCGPATTRRDQGVT